jgi:glycosyltransferase involved in cell wall biosynthesis
MSIEARNNFREMKLRKILYLNHVSYIGGAEVALLNLLTYLNRETYQPVALVPPGDLTEALKHLDVTCIPIPTLDGLNRHTLPRFLRVLPQLAAAISKETPDLVHANTNFTSEYAGILSRWTHIPTVGHIRDIEPLGRMGRWTVRQNTRLIAISDAVKQYLLDEAVPEHQLVRVYDGVDLAQYQTSQRTSPQDSGVILGSDSPIDSDIIIGIIGQIGQRKGHIYLLEAVRKIVKTCPHVKCWIIGKEPVHSTEQYTQRLLRYVQEHHLDPYVQFWGFRTDIPEILAQLDILVVPSLQEPFGKIVIEGMVMKKPVIASNVGGIPEIIVDGQTGILVPPGNAEALRLALESLLENRDVWEKMGVEARKRVEQLFSIDKNVRQTEHVYEGLLM